MLTFYLNLIDDDEDEKKFELLVHEYGSRMQHYAAKFLKDDFLAEDAVSEAFLRIACHMDGVGEINSPKTNSFIVTIVRNVCLDILRANQKYSFVSLDDETQKDSYSSIKLSYNLEEIDLSALLQKIRELPDIYRDVLQFKFHHGYSDKEIADMFKVSCSAVRKRIVRARELLEYSLREWR